MSCSSQQYDAASSGCALQIWREQANIPKKQLHTAKEQWWNQYKGVLRHSLHFNAPPPWGADNISQSRKLRRKPGTGAHRLFL